MSESDTSRLPGDDVVAVTGELIASKKMGAFVAHTFVAAGIAERARPGQHVSIAAGDETSGIVTRRSLPIRSVTPTGAFGGTVEVVVDPKIDASMAWIAGRRLHDEVSILGPLGRGFPIPVSGVSAVVAGVGASGASLAWLIRTLREASCQVPRAVIGGANDRELIDVIEARRLVGNVTVVLPQPNSLEYHLQVALDAALRESEPALVYAAGGVASLAAMTAAAQGRGVPLQGMFDVSMPCGTGLCRGCIIPVADARGEVRGVRCCTEGPVLPADRVAWANLLESAS